MEMHQLRYFVAVAEELHFGRAARRENVSQPPLSLQIKKLELELGVVLFERTKRRVAITEAGAAFLPEARSILAGASRAADVARQAHRGESGQVRLGFVHSASLNYLPRLVGPFRAAFPDISIRLEEMTVSEQLAALAKGLIDIGLARAPVEEPSLLSFDVVDEPFNVVVPRSHSLAARKRVRMEDLADEDFVFYPEHRSPAFFRQLVEMCTRAGFFPRVAVEANTMYTAIGLVGTGAGLAIVPESVSCVRSPSVSYLHLDTGSERACLSLVYRRERSSRCCQQMVEFARRSRQKNL